jgi:D-3-phosphoglycerate dehydrogenase
MARILVTDKLSPKGLEILRGGAEADEFLEWTPNDLIKKIRDYDALVVRSRTKVTGELIAAGHNLKVIGRAGTGLDNVDAKAAEARGVKVLNTPGANSLSVAELTIGLALALLRHIPTADKGVRGGLWDKKQLKGNEISKRTWGVIGLGHIGRLLAGMLSGFECKILAYDPYVKQGDADKVGATMVSMGELLKCSDIVSVHVPKLESTMNLISKKELKLMKADAILISISRGGIVDEDALYNALREKRIRGAAMDVFEKEPPVGSPLLGLDNVVFTCHLGAQTEEAQERAGVEIAKKVLEALGA